MKTTFIQDDLDLLQRHFDVTTFFGNGAKGVAASFSGPLKADVALSWFGSVYTWPMTWGARLRKIPSVVIIAGIDASREPSIGYGLWLSGWKSRILRLALDSCQRIFVVDDALGRDLRTYSGREWPQIETLPFGFDPDEWPMDMNKQPHVVTVARTTEEVHFRRKGIPILMEAARRLPDIPFTVVGTSPYLAQNLGFNPPANFEFVAAIPRTRVAGILRRAKVYCQVSIREGLPNALCEAMLCGCIPVGTRVAGIPTAIATTGYLVDYGRLDQLCEAIQSALDAPTSRGVEAREHIVRNFDKQKRDERLVSRIMDLLS